MFVGRFITSVASMPDIHLPPHSHFGLFLAPWRFNMTHRIILSGSFRFVADRLDQLSNIGYSIIDFGKEIDGNWFYVMEKVL